MDVAALIKKHEGLRLKPYKCSAGHWTVGYGHSLTAHNEKVPEIIDLGTAEALFQEDLNQATADCYEVVPEFSQFGDVRRAVFTDMAFNLGRAGLKGFRGTLAAVRRRDWPEVAVHMINSKWARVNPNRTLTLVGMILSNQW